MCPTWFDGSYPPSILTPEPPPSPPTGATAGSPGAWTPAGSETPANLAAANALGLALGAAWTEGQYVVLGDASEAHWNGTAFVAGRVPPPPPPEDGEEGAPAKRRRSSKTETEEES